MSVTRADPRQGILSLNCGGALPTKCVHVVGHDFQAIKLRLRLAQDFIERLAPAERVGGHDRAALAMRFVAHFSYANSNRKRERVMYAVRKKVALAGADFDAS